MINSQWWDIKEKQPKHNENILYYVARNDTLNVFGQLGQEMYVHESKAIWMLVSEDGGTMAHQEGMNLGDTITDEGDEFVCSLLLENEQALMNDVVYPNDGQFSIYWTSLDELRVSVHENEEEFVLALLPMYVEKGLATIELLEKGEHDINDEHLIYYRTKVRYGEQEYEVFAFNHEEVDEKELAGLHWNYSRLKN